MASGTIVVIAETKHRVIIAADSRAGLSDDGITIRSTDDHDCKIAPLGRRTAFSAAGILGNGASQWTAVSEAVRAAATISGPVGSIQGDLILKDWAESVMQRLADFSPQQLLSYAGTNDGHVTTGVLAGVEGDGRVWLRAVLINFSTAAGLSYQGYTLTSADPPTAYYFLGKSEIGLEFERDRTSSRAVKERAAWSKRKLTGAALDEFKARRLVELTIRYHPNKSEVGGPVNEIELDASGVHWVQVKPGCQGK